MSKGTLTGSRIRERRMIQGMRQADLARHVGISASYLNLIEHNRRRIGGKLLLALAKTLSVEPATLTEGAQAALLSALREAAAHLPPTELHRIEEFAERFPVWAEAMVQSYRQIQSLDATVRRLSDRLTHDSHLSASLHDVLSTTASIRSTASILAEPDGVDEEWRTRFLGNLDEDARRLAQSSKALVSFLDNSDSDDSRPSLPQEEVEGFLAENGYYFAELEQDSYSVQEAIYNSSRLVSTAAQELAARVLTQYAHDAQALPQAALLDTIRDVGFDPAAITRKFGQPLHVVFRRLAALPEAVIGRPVGLVICDASGAIVFRKPVEGFNLPLLGSSCPLWPMFTALTRPHRPIRRRVRQYDGGGKDCTCLAVSWAQGAVDFDHDPMLMAGMLILPETTDVPDALTLGASCRICSKGTCESRREVSIINNP